MSKEKIRVYLAGGFHSGWQNKVIKACGTKHFIFYDPRKKWMRSEITENHPSFYWPWNFQAIKKSEVVFAYTEDYRPKLLGPAIVLEMGYAQGLGKLVIYVNDVRHKYYEQFYPLFPSFQSLDMGIKYLKAFRSLK